MNVPQIKTILLTGARAPAALELARLFASAGHRVIVAESLARHLCGVSRAVAASYPVPAPKSDPDGFIQALLAIIEKERIDLLVPTCEEVFYVARGHAALSERCEVLTLPLARLEPLHSKWAFIQKVKALGLAVPRTWLLRSPSELQDLLQGEASEMKLVLKPVYSRFATQIHFLTPGQAAPDLPLSPETPWVAQERIYGRPICTYGVARQGRLLAHSAYAADFTAGLGACINFEALGDEQLEKWVARVVEAEDYTGQIAFDFIETQDGTLYPLECNPRATSGVHLFQAGDGLDQACFGTLGAMCRPQPGSRAMLGLAMGVYGLPAINSRARLKNWLRVMGGSRDALFRFQDPRPFFQQFQSFAHFLLQARRHHINALEASTLDIEWNGPS